MTASGASTSLATRHAKVSCSISWPSYKTSCFPRLNFFPSFHKQTSSNTLQLLSINFVLHFRTNQQRQLIPNQQNSHIPSSTSIMARGEGQQTKVHFKGKEDDFIVFVDDATSFKKWQGDKTVPLAQVVNSFKIFVTHK